MGVADRADAFAVGDEVESRRALLARPLEVRLQPDNGPVIDLPIVTGLAATDETIESLGARIACRSSDGGKTRIDVRALGSAPAIAGVAADVPTVQLGVGGVASAWLASSSDIPAAVASR